MEKKFRKILKILPREFYARDTVKVAKELLGKKIVRRIGNTELIGIITETEAYCHLDDPASHAFCKITERNKAMFGEVGRAYVYFTYGMYYCFNVVARNPKAEAGAVLIRSMHPEKGIEIMQKNRNLKDEKNISNGPAKITQALKISKKQYGVDLTKKSEIYILEGIKIPRIISQPRIGISKAKEKFWNFKIKI